MRTIASSSLLMMFVQLLLLPQRVSAQSNPVPVSVRSAVAAALDTHGSVQIAAERVNAAKAAVDEASARMLPKVNLTGRAFVLSDVEQGTITVPFLPGSPSIPLFPVITHSYAARVQVSQPVFTGFRLASAKEAASFGAEAARAELTREESTLALMTEKAYWGWVQARQAQHVLEDMAAQMRSHEQRVQHLSEQGLARQSDVLSVRVRRSDVEVKAVEARTMAAVAAMRLNSIMGNPLETELMPQDDPTEMTFTEGSESADALVTKAIDARPDLASARLRTDMARSAVGVAGSGWYPSIQLAAAYEYSNPNQRIIPPKERFDGTWEVGLTFQWTVWDWMTASKQTAQATAAQRQAESAYELMLDGTKLEVAQLWRSVEDSRERIRSARLALDAAEESFRIMEEQYDKGMATTVDVTDARVEVLRAKLAYSKTAAEAAITRAELRHAIGETR